MGLPTSALFAYRIKFVKSFSAVFDVMSPLMRTVRKDVEQNFLYALYYP